MNCPTIKKEGGKPHANHAVLALRFHGQRTRRGNGVWLLRCKVYGPRVDEHVAERGPVGG